MIDVLVGLFIAVTGVLTCLSFLTVGRRYGQQSEIQTIAYQAAYKELEVLRGMKFKNRVPVSTAYFPISKEILDQVPGQKMTGTYSISDFGSSSYPRLHQIVVKVTWTRTDSGADTKSSVQLDSLAAEEPHS